MHDYDKLCIFIIFVLIFILIIYRNKSRYLIKEQFKTIANNVISDITNINKDLNNMTTFENIYVLGNLTVNGNAAVKKNSTFKNNVTINGITTINGNAILKNNLTVNKESQFNNNVNIDKNKSLTSKNINTYILNPTNNCKESQPNNNVNIDKINSFLPININVDILQPSNNKEIKIDSSVLLSNDALLDGNADFKKKLTFRSSDITKQIRRKYNTLCWANPCAPQDYKKQPKEAEY